MDWENHVEHWNEPFADNPDFLEATLDRTKRCVIRDKNRPSVICWSMGNESAYGCCFEAALAWTKRFDPSRLTHYESAQYRSRKRKYDFSNIDLYYIIISLSYILTQLYASVIGMGTYYAKYILGNEELFPHYFIGSNADLPIVGGSILTHEHFQGGHFSFPMERAPIERKISFKGYEDVTAGIVKWPMSVIRITCPDKNRLCDLATKILMRWRIYTDKAAFIYAKSGGEPHNTITPIARRRGEDYELDLVLRNNITTERNPLGEYHPHAELHHIKKENIGLIEVMGLAVLPARLKQELAGIEKAILCGTPLTGELAKHEDWVNELLKKQIFTPENTASMRSISSSS